MATAAVGPQASQLRRQRRRLLIDIHRVLEIVERDLPPLEQAIDGLLNKP